MVIVGQKQRICTGLSIASGAARELGIVRGTLGASKILLRLWGGSAASTLTAPTQRPSWDGATASSSAPLAWMSQTVESTRDVNLTTELTGIICISRPVGEGFFTFPAYFFSTTPSVTTLITVDAWVFYDAQPGEWFRQAREDVSLYQPLLPA